MWRKCFKVVAGIEYREREREECKETEREEYKETEGKERSFFFFLGRDMKPHNFFCNYLGRTLLL